MSDNCSRCWPLLVACLLLLQACGEPSPEPYFQQLRDRDAAERTKAANALLRFGKEIVPRLIEEYGSGYTRVRFEVVQLMGKLKDRRSVPTLIAALEDKSASVAGAAAWALGELRAPEALPQLLRSADDASKKVRRYAIYALGPCHNYDREPALSDSAYKIVFLALKDKTPDIRIAALQSIREFGYRGVVEDIIRLSRDPSPKVRHVAAQALGQIATGDAPNFVSAITEQTRNNIVEALLAALDEGDFQSIRTKAVRALGEIGARRVVPHLRRLQEQGTDEDRRETRRIIEKLMSPTVAAEN